MINTLKERSLSRWWEASSNLTKVIDKVSFSDKIKNEKKMEAFRKQLFSSLEQIPEGEESQPEWKEKVINQIKTMESNLSYYSISIIDFFIDRGYGKVTDDFIKMVKEFDPYMNVYDIFQAIRNVWIMNSIQILYGMEVELTASIFAYSMLYPYSDNYLDDSNISLHEKQEFNRRFLNWIKGEVDYPVNYIEENILKLIEMIEEDYDRGKYPQVYSSLLAIHKAQDQSLIQQRDRTLPYEKDIIGISFEKGGTSVLADAYLVKGSLSLDEANFMFSYGTLLQLIDDLQDVEEDSTNSHMTIFSQLDNCFKLDKLVYKLINYIDDFFANEACFKSESAVLLKQVIRDCSYVMLYEAVSKQKHRFSKECYKCLEDQAIVRFSYLKKVKKKYQRTFSEKDIIKVCEVLSD
jgi:hypothetical protein